MAVVVGGGGAATVSGKAIANSIAGATVTVFSVKPDGSDDQTLCSGTTGADGSFSISGCKTPASGEGVRIQISGGSYTSEADTSKTISGSGLSILVPAMGGASGIVITPLTTFADSNASAALAKGGGTSLSAIVDAAEAVILKNYGLPAGTDLSALAPDFTAASGPAASAALILGTLEQLAINTGRPPADIVAAIASDLSDGVPDGKTASGAPVTYPDGSAAPNTLANSDLLSALSDYLSNPNTETDKAGTTIDPATVADTRGAVVSATPSSFALDIGSSGAVTELVSSGKQLVVIAARTAGVQAVDITDPTKPAVQDLSTLNTALAALPADPVSHAPFTSIGGVLAVPGSGTEVALFEYSQPRLVVVDVASQKVIHDLDLSGQLKTITNFSGGSAYISGGITDFTRNLIWLATGDGYFPYDPAANKLGTPIPLGGTLSGSGAGATVTPDIIAENIGGATDPANNLLFAPNYGPNGSGGSLQIVDLTKNKAYTLDDAQFQGAFMVQYGTGSPSPFNIVDSGAFDSVYHVGVLLPEGEDYVGFLDMHDPSKLAYDDSTCGASNNGCAFTLKDYSVSTDPATGITTGSSPEAKTLLLTPVGGYAVEGFSGSAIDSTTHLVMGMGGYENDFFVAKLDDPAHPANTNWAGFTQWKYYEATGSEYSYAEDPHGVGALQSTANGKSYGFVLSSEGGSSGYSVIMVDMAAFLAAPATAGDPHQLSSSPFDGTVIKTLALGTAGASTAATKAMAISAKPRAPQKHYGTTQIAH